MKTSRLLGLALGFAVSGLAWAQPLTFEAAIALAERQSPRLAAQSALIEAAEAAAMPAAALPDPKLALGIDNIPVSGPDRGSLTDDFMTMQKIGLMQEIPNAAKRAARKDIAQAEIDLQLAKRRLDRLIVRRETAKAWINRYFVEKRFALVDALEQEIRLLSNLVAARIAGGGAMVSEALLPQQEAAEVEDLRDEFLRERRSAIAELRRWVGEAAEAPLSGAVPVYAIDAERLREQLGNHPEIAMFNAMQQYATAEAREAEAAKQPDYGVEFSYGRRGEAYDDMVSLQFTVDLPLFPASRQEPQIRAKRIRLSGIEAERNERLRLSRSKLEDRLAEFEMLTRQCARMRTEWLPLSEKQLALQLAAYRSGNATLNQVIDARRESIDRRIKAFRLDGKREALAAELSMFYGEAIP